MDDINGFVAEFNGRHIEVIEHPDMENSFCIALGREYSDNFTKKDVEKNKSYFHQSKEINDKEYSILNFSISGEGMEALIGCYSRVRSKREERLEYEKLKIKFEGEDNG